MSCILRASGEELDVDLYLKGKDLDISNVYRKGEARRLPSKSGELIQQRSGISIQVSYADMNQFDKQLTDALNFLKTNNAAIRELINTPEVSVYLDFGVETSSPFWSSYIFPSNIVSLAGELKVGLGISTYPVDENEET